MVTRPLHLAPEFEIETLFSEDGEMTVCVIQHDEAGHVVHGWTERNLAKEDDIDPATARSLRESIQQEKQRRRMQPDTPLARLM